MPSRPLKALLAIEPGVDAEQVQESLPDDPEFNIVSVATNAEDTIRSLSDSPVDLLLVACAGCSDSDGTVRATHPGS